MRRAIAFILLVAATATFSTAQSPTTRATTPGALVAAASSARASSTPLASPGHDKCGTWLGIAIRDHAAEFSLKERLTVEAFLAPPALQKSRVIGHFRIHYDTTGFNAASMLDVNELPLPGTSEAYVDSVGAVFNAVLDAEVSMLGYASPIAPGDIYNIYCSDIGFYGLTQTTDRIGTTTPPRFSSFIEIDNDFRGFYSAGLQGLRVTAAHEFHHAIQFAGYGFWNGMEYLMEITSTWMEDVVYDDVNDFVQYLRDPYVPTPIARGQFAAPELSFTATNGLIEYSRCIWGKYLERRHSRDLMRSIWEAIRSSPPLDAMDQALLAAGSSFREAFLEWSGWNSRTWGSADTVHGYRESASFPPVRIRATYDYASPSRSYPDSINALSSGYHLVNVAGHTMLAIISNLDRTLPAGPQRFRYEIQDASESSFKRLSNGVSVRVAAAVPANWASQEDVPSIVPEVVVYPNPFLVGRSPHISFRLPVTTASTTVSLVVLTAGLDAVFSGSLPVLQPRPLEQNVAWNARDDRGRSLSSGVYLFALKVDGNEYTGKFSVIGE